MYSVHGAYRAVVEELEKHGVRWVLLQFLDVAGFLRQVAVPAREFSEGGPDVFVKGFGKLDGSSVKGFRRIEESDLALVPVPETMALVPWSRGAARFIARVYDGLRGERLPHEPRLAAEKAEELAASQGYRAFVGPEVEFFLFDSVELDFAAPFASQGVRISSREAPWGGGGDAIWFKEGYYPATPIDRVFGVRQEIAEVLEDYFGFRVEAHHHEAATAGQCEIDFRFGGVAEAGDRVATLKFVARNIAARHGMVAVFMPKPLYGDNGSGMHVHVSLWSSDGSRNLFYDPNDDYAELSQVGRYFIGGLLEHARSLAAIVAPTTNSYRRLVPGYEAPVYIAWSRANRSACVRVPAYHRGDEKGKRIEFRPPDPSANPYLAFAAIVAAGLDGVRRKIDPGDPVDENIYLMSPEKRRALGIKSLPANLKEALEELESDSEYLKPVFTDELLESYVELKREEVRYVNSFPTPAEFRLYLNL
ncbi:MAG: type I glutamate--ammonia ligase [Thermoprotei archaeon]|nr:MAG: type I glutamate--ammonia ligase [Thermoprotei archaeon]